MRSGVGETASRIVVNTITLIGNPDGAFQTQMRKRCASTEPSARI
jgi:hypothetical protein